MDLHILRYYLIDFCDKHYLTKIKNLSFYQKNKSFSSKYYIIEKKRYLKNAIKKIRCILKVFNQ